MMLPSAWVTTYTCIVYHYHSTAAINAHSKTSDKFWAVAPTMACTAMAICLFWRTTPTYISHTHVNYTFELSRGYECPVSGREMPQMFYSALPTHWRQFPAEVFWKPSKYLTALFWALSSDNDCGYTMYVLTLRDVLIEWMLGKLGVSIGVAVLAIYVEFSSLQPLEFLVKAGACQRSVSQVVHALFNMYFNK